MCLHGERAWELCTETLLVCLFIWMFLIYVLYKKLVVRIALPSCVSHSSEPLDLRGV